MKHDSVQACLVDTLFTFAEDLREGITEFELIKRLQAPPFSIFSASSLNTSLGLFQTHFLLFNALYHLQEKWLLERIGILRIHTLNIELQPFSENDAGLQRADPLRAYYADWQNLESTSETDVDALIDSFWKQWVSQREMVTEDQEVNARQVLEISQNEQLSAALLKKQYRQMQHRHHPDKGGNNARAQAVSDAYAVLLKVI